MFKRYLIVVGVILMFIAGVAGIVITLNDKATAAKTDSGVRACEQMADRINAGQKASGGEMTEQSYVKTLEPYEASNHEDLKLAGVNFVNAVWDAQQALKTIEQDENQLATSMGIITKINATYANLQIACSRHGVALASLPKT